jgi:hypothetical protein
MLPTVGSNRPVRIGQRSVSVCCVRLLGGQKRLPLVSYPVTKQKHLIALVLLFHPFSQNKSLIIIILADLEQLFHSQEASNNKLSINYKRYLKFHTRRTFTDDNLIQK